MQCVKKKETKSVCVCECERVDQWLFLRQDRFWPMKALRWFFWLKGFFYLPTFRLFVWLQKRALGRKKIKGLFFKF